MLFNCAALASQIAQEQNLDNDEGLKTAAKQYQVCRKAVPTQGCTLDARGDWHLDDSCCLPHDGCSGKVVLFSNLILVESESLGKPFSAAALVLVPVSVFLSVLTQHLAQCLAHNRGSVNVDWTAKMKCVGECHTFVENVLNDFSQNG